MREETKLEPLQDGGFVDYNFQKVSGNFILLLFLYPEVLSALFS